GHELAVLVRPTSRTGPLEELGADLFTGDVADRYSMREGMSGADWVVHAAAELDFGATGERIHSANVEGSRNVASLAWKLGVGRVLAISSIARFGGSPADGAAGNEDSPLLSPPSRYSATKLAGERAMRELAEQGLRLNVVYPSFVYGPPGAKRGGNLLLRGVLKRRWPMLVGADRVMSWIYLDDLVEAMARVMERAEPGRDYVLAGGAAILGEIVERAAELGGVEPPRWRLPLPLAMVLGRLSAPFYRLRGWRPPLNPEQLRSLAVHWHFDDGRARAELDWRPRGLDEGLPATVEYLLDA
ncbi:MAG: NAD-dependent epimerase/dehydratase family protein, partial [Thermoanaerobaculia bacterium]